jgi:hypothetical protein
MTNNPVSNRTIGDYPLSIALSLALSGIQGVHPDRPTGKNLLPKYSVVWVNLRTMFRNLYNAILKEEILGVLPNELFDGLMQEIDQFERIIQAESKGKIQVVYYLSDYANMEREYPNAILRKDSTETQATYSLLQKICLTAVMKALDRSVRRYSLKITDTEARKALLLTHCSIDLFSKGFRDKSLWESHTGAVKEKHQWYTKYYNGKDLTMIPFREDFIQLFGDNEHFRPMSIKVRKEIIDLAISTGWSQVTTRDKIVYSLDKLQTPATRDLIRSIMY